ncbi:MAG: tryptophan--tRNA ligase [Promethearchaeota archaeon]
MKDFIVTPWEVKGDVDYEKLVEQFGIKLINQDILKSMIKITGFLHPYLERRIFFAHRDLDWILNEYKKNNKFYLYTGRGPSGDIHIGHIIPWIFTKWLQDTFDVELWFQMTDDEKFYFKENITLERTNKLAYENALDVIAIGFNPKKTFIFSDIELAGVLYKYAAKIAKKITYSMIRATFGLNESSNIGQIFFTSMQAVPAILKTLIEDRNVPCLIPHAVDQDPHFRIARDILPKLGYYKPASIQCIFLPGLKEKSKMSTSEGDDAIFSTDTEKDIRKKVGNAFTGGRGSSKEQRELGGDPNVCSVYKYFYMAFMLDNDDLSDLKNECLSGDRLCGECKSILTERIIDFLKNHQEKREKARDKLNEYWISGKKDIKQLVDKKLG